MKLSPRDAPGYFARPDPASTGLLLYGADPMRVAHGRKQMLASLLGPGAEEEMRLTRLPGSDIRREAAPVIDAMKAQGFFPGPRAVLVEDCTDTAFPALEAALQDWQPGDAQVVVTAGALKASSKLRKLFEGHRTARAAAFYDEPPGRAEIERMLAQGGLRDVPGEAMATLTALAGEVGPGDFTQIVEKIALYKRGDDTPLSPADIEANAPQSTEAALDDLLHIVAEGRSAEIGPVLRRLQSQGANPVGLCIGATRHFRLLYAAASDPGGPGAGIGRVRPPVFGARRDRLLRQAQGWGAAKLETALTLLTDTDLSLRSAGQTAPAMALVERALIRLAMMNRSR